jgi:hypothetical protein
MRNTVDVTGVKPITVRLQSFSGVITVGLFVVPYDISGRKGEV